MDDAGVDRCAAQPDDHKTHRQRSAARQKQQRNTHGNECLPQADHLVVGEPYRQEPAQKPAARNAQIEQACPAGGGGGIQTAYQRAVAGSPHPGDRLNARVERETAHHLRHAGYFHQLRKGAMLGGKVLPCPGIGGGLPQRQAE